MKRKLGPQLIQLLKSKVLDLLSISENQTESDSSSILVTLSINKGL